MRSTQRVGAAVRAAPIAVVARPEQVEALSRPQLEQLLAEQAATLLDDQARDSDGAGVSVAAIPRAVERLGLVGPAQASRTSALPLGCTAAFFSPASRRLECVFFRLAKLVVAGWRKVADSQTHGVALLALARAAPGMNADARPLPFGDLAQKARPCGHRSVKGSAEEAVAQGRRGCHHGKRLALAPNGEGDHMPSHFSQLGQRTRMSVLGDPETLVPVSAHFHQVLLCPLGPGIE